MPGGTTSATRSQRALQLVKRIREPFDAFVTCRGLPHRFVR